VPNNQSSEKKLNIWQVSREMAPFAEAGGIKDVVSGLSSAISRFDHKVTVVLPMYQFLLCHKKERADIQFCLSINDKNEEINVHMITYNSIRVFFVSADCFTSKSLVYTYSREEEKSDKRLVYGMGHTDSHFMNLILQRSVLEIALFLNEKPDIFHLHDGHTGFLPAIMRHNERYKSHYIDTSSLLTVHNAGIVYQQNISSLNEAVKLTGLQVSVLEDFHTEYGYSPLVCAGMYGDVNTVSERYAKDILNNSDISSGSLGDVFKTKKIKFSGITNGIEISKYKTPLFPHTLEPRVDENLNLWKVEYKSSFFKVLNNIYRDDYVFGSLIEDPALPLITMQSRLTYQKGVDIFYESLVHLLSNNTKANFLVLGEGAQVYEQALSEIASGKKNFCYIRKYDEVLSQYLFAAGDVFIIPSRWEPCGLTDFIAQLFGNIPIVHETGGLSKTKDMINGFSYKDNDSETLASKIEQVINFYGKEPQVLHDIRKNAVNLINENYTWEKVFIKGYLPFYRKITRK